MRWSIPRSTSDCHAVPPPDGLTAPAEVPLSPWVTGSPPQSILAVIRSRISRPKTSTVVASPPMATTSPPTPSDPGPLTAALHIVAAPAAGHRRSVIVGGRTQVLGSHASHRPARRTVNGDRPGSFVLHLGHGRDCRKRIPHRGREVVGVPLTAQEGRRS